MGENVDWREGLKAKTRIREVLPERSENYINNFHDKYLPDFFIKINEELKEFYSVFDDVLWENLKFNDDGVVFERHVRHGGAVWLSINLRAASCRFVIYWEFERFKYIINFNIGDSSAFKIENRYDEAISEDDKNSIVELIGKEMLKVAERAL